MSFSSKVMDILNASKEWFATPAKIAWGDIKLDAERKGYVLLLMAFSSLEVLVYFFPSVLHVFPDARTNAGMANFITFIIFIWCLACAGYLFFLMCSFPLLLVVFIFFIAEYFFDLKGPKESGILGIFALFLSVFALIKISVKFKITWEKNLEAKSYMVFFLSILIFLLSLLIQGGSGLLWPLTSRDLPLVIGGSNVSLTEIVGLPFALIGSYPALIGVPLTPAQSGAAQGVLFLFVAAIMLLVWARNLLSDSGGRVHPLVVFVAFCFFVTGLCAEIASHSVSAQSFTRALSESGKDLNYFLPFFIALRRVLTVIALAVTIFLASGAKNYLSAESIPWTSNILAQANSWAERRVWKLIPWVFGLVLAATLLTQFWPEGLPIYVQDVFGLALAWFLMKFIGLPRAYRLMCSRHYTAKQMWDSSYKPPALVPDDDEVERNL